MPNDADIYAANILDHFKRPRNKRELEHPTVTHSEENLSCGDDLTVQLLITNDTVDQVGWYGHGCAIHQAAMSILSEEIEHMHTSDVLRLSKNDVYKWMGVPIGPRRYKCALMCLHAVKNALRKARGLEPQGWLATVEILDD